MGFSSSDNKVTINVGSYSGYGNNTKNMFKSTEYDDDVEIDYNQNIDEENTVDTDSSAQAIIEKTKDFSQNISTSWSSWFGAQDKVGQLIEDWTDGSAEGKFDFQKIKDFNEKHDRSNKGIVGKANERLDNLDVGDHDYVFGQNFSSVKLADIELLGRPEDDPGYVLGLSGEKQWDHGSVSGEISLGHYDYGANLEIGPDHIVLSAKAEASLLHVEGSGNVGLSMSDVGVSEDSIFSDLTLVGAAGNVKADVARVYAEGKIGAGFYKGEDGKFHTDLGIKGEIGADLCSAEASGNVNLLGLGVGGKAKVKVGVGAQLNVGFTDGKFNFNIGLAAGIGFELGFSIDVSDWVDVGVKVWNKTTESVGEVWNDTKEWVGEAWEDTKEWASDTWDSACDWVGDAWEDTKDFFSSW